MSSFFFFFFNRAMLSMRLIIISCQVTEYDDDDDDDVSQTARWSSVNPKVVSRSDIPGYARTNRDANNCRIVELVWNLCVIHAIDGRRPLISTNRVRYNIISTTSSTSVTNKYNNTYRMPSSRSQRLREEKFNQNINKRGHVSIGKAAEHTDETRGGVSKSLVAFFFVVVVGSSFVQILRMFVPNK